MKERSTSSCFRVFHVAKGSLSDMVDPLLLLLQWWPSTSQFVIYFFETHIHAMGHACSDGRVRSVLWFLDKVIIFTVHSLQRSRKTQQR